jgi:hypothetical protein
VRFDADGETIATVRSGEWKGYWAAARGAATEWPLFELQLCSGTAAVIWRNFVRRVTERLIDVSDDHANSVDPTSPYSPKA